MVINPINVMKKKRIVMNKITLHNEAPVSAGMSLRDHDSHLHHA